MRGTICVALIALVSSTARGAYFSTDFETDPFPSGWHTASPAQWTTEDAHSGTRAIRVAESPWGSPFYSAQASQWIRQEFWTKGAGATAVHSRYSMTPSTGWVRNEYMIRGGGANIGFSNTGVPYYVDDVTAEPATSAQAADWSDTVYNSLGATVRLGTNTGGQFLTQAAAAMREGRALKVVMLGDSIVNDTSVSTFDALLERRFPGLAINLVISVRGSTGAWYYKDVSDTGEGPEVVGVPRVKSYVLDHNPDLVMIGGISNQDNIDAMESVVDQIRAGSDTDILLMTGAVGFDDPDAMNVNFDVTTADNDWRGKLMALAEEKSTGFLDMTGTWHEFVKDSDKGVDFFRRDPLHANHRGQEVLARNIDGYFAAVVPEPVGATTVSLLALWTLASRRRRS